MQYVIGLRIVKEGRYRLRRRRQAGGLLFRSRGSVNVLCGIAHANITRRRIQCHGDVKQFCAFFVSFTAGHTLLALLIPAPQRIHPSP